MRLVLEAAVPVDRDELRVQPQQGGELDLALPVVELGGVAEELLLEPGAKRKSKTGMVAVFRSMP